MWFLISLLLRAEAYIQLIDPAFSALFRASSAHLEFPATSEELQQCVSESSYAVSAWVKFEVVPAVSQTFISLVSGGVPYLTVSLLASGSVEATAVTALGTAVTASIAGVAAPSWIFVGVSTCSVGARALVLSKQSWNSVSKWSSSMSSPQAFTALDGTSVLRLGGEAGSVMVVRRSQGQLLDVQFDCSVCRSAIVTSTSACYGGCAGGCFGPGDKSCSEFIQLTDAQVPVAFTELDEVSWPLSDPHLQDYAFTSTDFSLSGWFADTENINDWRLYFIAENIYGSCCNIGQRVLAIFRHSAPFLHFRADSTLVFNDGTPDVPISVSITQMGFLGHWQFIGMSVCSGVVHACYALATDTSMTCLSQVINGGTLAFGSSGTERLVVGGYGMSVVGDLADQRFYPSKCVSEGEFEALFQARRTACTVGCSACSTPFDCSTCSAGYYPSGRVCKPCNSCCSACSSAGNCSACSTSCYPVTASTCACNVSADCEATCGSCSAALAWSCNTCTTGFALHPYGSHLCFAACPSGYTSASGVCTGTDQMVMDYRLDMITPTVSGVNGQSARNGASFAYFPPSFEGSDPVPAKRRGYYFAGSQYVQLPPAASTTGAPTVIGTSTTFSTWIRPQGSGVRTIYSKEEGGASIFTVRVSASQRIEFVGGYELKTYSHPTALTVDSWSFVVLTFQFSSTTGKTTCAVYINGALSGTTYELPLYLKDSSVTAPQVIGASTSLTNFYLGFIWRVRFYNHVWTTFISEMSSAGCPAGLSYCLSSEPITNTPEGTLCLPTCTNGCVRSTDCSLCQDELCEVCIGFFEAGCTTCIANASPLTPCQCSGFYDSAARSCEDCPPECVGCSSAAVCLACSLNAEAAGGLCACVSGFYPDPDPANCRPCHPFCLSCSAEESCTDCKPHAELRGDECVCVEGYSGPPDACIACDSTCLACASEKECSLCKANASLVDAQCVCDEGFYPSPNAGNCVVCNPSCVACSSATVCTKCAANAVIAESQCQCSPGFFPSPSVQLCEACDPSCLSCLSAAVCTACKPHASLRQSECRCVPGYYGPAADCQACGFGCAECSGFPCQRCEAGLYYADGWCVSACPPGFVSNETAWLCEKSIYAGELTATLQSSPPASFILTFSAELKSSISLDNATIEVCDLEGLSVTFTPSLTELAPTLIYNLTISVTGARNSEYFVLVRFSSANEILDRGGNALVTEELTGALSFLNDSESANSVMAPPPYVSTAAATSKGSVAGGFITSFLSGSPGSLFTLFNNLQTLAYLPLSGIEMPQSLRGLLASLNLGSFLPNPFLYWVAGDSGPPPPQFAASFGYSSCVFVTNVGVMLSAGVALAVTSVSLRVLSLCPIRFLSLYFSKVSADLGSHALLRYWTQVYLDGCLAAFLQLRSLHAGSFSSVSIGLNCSIAMLTAAAGIATPALCAYSVVKARRSPVHPFFTTFNEASGKGALYYTAFFLQRLVYALSLIFMSTYPWYQSLLFTVLSTAVRCIQALAYTLYCSPSKQRLEMLTAVCSQTCVCAVFALTTAYNYRMSARLSKVVETTCTLCVYCSILISNVAGLVGALVVLRKLWRSYVWARQVAFNSDSGFSSRDQVHSKRRNWF